MHERGGFGSAPSVTTGKSCGCSGDNVGETELDLNASPSRDDFTLAESAARRRASNSGEGGSKGL